MLSKFLIYKVLNMKIQIQNIPTLIILSQLEILKTTQFQTSLFPGLKT